MNNKASAKDLDHFSLFASLSEDAKAELLESLKYRTFEEGHEVCIEGQRDASMFFILKGSVFVSKCSIQLAILDQGDYFGEMSLLAGRERDATITCIEDCTLLEMDQALFDSCIKNTSEAILDITLTFDRRLRRHNEILIEQYLEIQKKYRELHEAHQDLLQTEKLATIGVFTAGVAHEINNPLTVINGYLNLVIKNLNSEKSLDREKLLSSCEKIQLSAERIKEMVIGLKNYARKDGIGLMELDLNDAVMGAINLISFLYEKEGITIDTQLFDGQLTILGNIGQIQQVLMNLLSNAKYAVEGREEKKISVKTYHRNNRAFIELSDSGQGIKKEDQSKIFTKFFTTKRPGQGTGIGLDIVKNLVTSMLGDISFKSRYEKGTTFVIKFPLKDIK